MFFHHLELSFKKVIILYRVYTTSPNSFIEQWNTLLCGDIHKLPPVEFEVLPNPSLLNLIDSMDEKVLKDLGTDHRVFIGCIRMIITGIVDERFINMNIGRMITARFATTETRFVRAWLSTPDPGFEQICITRYIV